MISETSDVTVSVICTAFNHESYIRDCLDGFLNQVTDFRVEVLIHDDASTDSTAQIIREYESKYPEIIRPIYQKENQFSKGIRPSTLLIAQAKGRYIAYCEGDDYWTDPLKLQKQVDFMEANPEYSLCGHDVQIVFEGVPAVDDLYGEPLLDADFRSLVGYPVFIALNSILTRTVYYRNAPTWFSGPKVFHKTIILYLATQGRIRYVRDVMAVKRKNPGGITQSKTSTFKKRKDGDLSFCYKKLLNVVTTRDDKKALFMELYRLHRKMERKHRSQGQYVESVKALGLGLMYLAKGKWM